MTVFLGLDYEDQIWFYRVAVWVVPAIGFFAARRACRGLQAIERSERRKP